MEQTDLRTHRTPARLAFADHMNRLVTGNCAPSAPERPEMLTGADPALDGPVILFQVRPPVDRQSAHAPEFESNDIIPLKDFTFLPQCDCLETSYAQKSTC